MRQIPAMLFYNLDTSESHWEKQIEFPFGKRRYNSKGDLWTGCSSVVALSWSILTIIFSVSNSKSNENNFFMEKRKFKLLSQIYLYLYVSRVLSMEMHFCCCFCIQR